MQKQADVNMTFESFAQLYEKDMKPKLKLNTWLTKESIIQKKILPYFGKRKLSEITAKDVMDWQNTIRGLTDAKGKPYSPTYLKTCLLYTSKSSNPPRKGRRPFAGTAAFRRVQGMA